MNHTRTAALVLAAMGLLLTGCSSPTPAKPTDAKPGLGTLCSGMAWPRPVPDGLNGKPLTQAAAGPLLCFTVAKAVAPDGHDAMQDDTATTNWIVTGSSPDAGTAINQDQPITLTVTKPNG
ncbi:hypothetical protein [Streptomyces sp. NPDC050485]|uniref:hypothetical protein n=1 Tax=Streptomyces sp. NPDC050485 TaxID=3365617 RepID=UPI0037A6DF0D